MSGFSFVAGFLAGLIAVGRVLSGRSEQDDAAPVRDEDMTAAVRSEWRRLGLLTDGADVTVIDGVGYLRGRADPTTADTLLAVARGLPGVREIRDEIKREA